MNRLLRALRAAWRAFVAELRAAPVVVSVQIEFQKQQSIASQAEAFGEAAVERTFLVKRFDPEPFIVYNDVNGSQARELFLAEKRAGNTATFAMFSGGQWQLRDWCPR